MLYLYALSLHRPNEMNGIGCHPNEVFILILGLRSTPAAGCKVSFLVKHFMSKPGKLLNYDFGVNRNLSACAVYWNGCSLSHPNCLTFLVGVERWLKAITNAQPCYFFLRWCVCEYHNNIEKLIHLQLKILYRDIDVQVGGDNLNWCF